MKGGVSANITIAIIIGVIAIVLAYIGLGSFLQSMQKVFGPQGELAASAIVLVIVVVLIYIILKKVKG